MGLIGNLKNKNTSKPADKPATGAKPQGRTDDGHAKAECLEQATTLIKLGITRPDVLVTLQKRFVGLPKDVIEALVASVPDAEDAQGVNPPDSPEEPEEIVEEKAPKGRKAAASKKVDETPKRDAGPVPTDVAELMFQLMAAGKAKGLSITISVSA